MPTGAVIGAAAIGAGSSAYGANQAADASESAAKRAAETYGINAKKGARTLRDQFEMGQADISPYMTTGLSANNKLANLYGLETSDPNQYLTDMRNREDTNKLMEILYDKKELQPLFNEYGVSSAHDDINLTEDQWQEFLDNPYVNQSNKRRRKFDQLHQLNQPRVVEGQAPAPTAIDSDQRYADFFNSPDYQFAFDEGQRALDRSAASKGRLFSGAQMRASNRYGQGMASQQLNTYANRLQSIANTGYNAASQGAGNRNAFAANLANIKTGAGAAQGNALMNAGNAQAAGYLGMGNAVNQGLNNALSIYGMQQGGYFGNNNTPQTPQRGSGYNNFDMGSLY